MGKYLEKCTNDAWDVIRGRKKIVGNKIIEVVDESKNEEKKEIEYGWLAPDGIFYPVEFGNHQAWAAEYLLNLYRNGRISYEEAKNNQNVGDVLVDRGWVLIHNPSQQNIQITRNLSKIITKAQKDFLYEFLYKHGKLEEANKLYS